MNTGTSAAEVLHETMLRTLGNVLVRQNLTLLNITNNLPFKLIAIRLKEMVTQEYM